MWPLRCSSRGGCHCTIISEDDLAEPTKPRGGPDGATIKYGIFYNYLD